jgi:hypothetical protein
MSHLSLEIENWKLIDLTVNTALSYNERVSYYALNIDARNFYYFLKERFGSPNVEYETVKHFFQERDVILSHYWCFGFKSETNYIFVSGDNLINITILSINEPPQKLDFDIFCINTNNLLKDFKINKYQNNSFDIYINYRFFLNNLIQKFKEQEQNKLPFLPESFQKNMGDAPNYNSKDEQFEYELDYNNWLQSLIDKATLSLQIQILLPIHFESLIDLSFRIKLKKSLYNVEKKYGRELKKDDIFENFEKLPLYKKIEEIQKSCLHVNSEKANKFISDINNNGIRKKRNKLLHGNSLFFKNVNSKLYYDEKYLIGFPDHHNSKRFIAESIQNAIVNDNLVKDIAQYERYCEDFMNIFDDDESFKTIITSISFGINPKNGMLLSMDFDNLKNLFINNTTLK